MKGNPEARFIFFGSSAFSIYVLDSLGEAGLAPALIISTPDKPKGRGQKLSPSPVKVWAEEHGIDVLTPEKLDNNFVKILQVSGFRFQVSCFLVASYGKIIPPSVFELPPRGALNIHPSLLPCYRGPSPIESMILADDEDSVGATIIKIDEEVDHGPILAREKVEIKNWPVGALELEHILGTAGGRLFARILPDYLSGKIVPINQDDTKATFTKKLSKVDGEIDLAQDPAKNFLKIKAFEGWPGAYFFAIQSGKKIRVLIKKAELRGRELIIKSVVPEGKKEMPYEDFSRGMKTARQ